MMPRLKKTLQDECIALLDRYSHLSNRQKGYLRIYVKSLIERITAMDYSYDVLSRLIGTQALLTTVSFAPFEDHGQKRNHYANCFWASAYSVFDIFSHVINTIYPSVIDESWVSFNGAVHGYNQIPNKAQGMVQIPPRVMTKLLKTSKTQYFNRLAAYRQCSMHRREVCVFEESTTVSISNAYVGSTVEFKPNVVTWICDNPDDKIPKFKKKRCLQDECSKIRDRIEEDIRKIIRIL